MAAAMSAMMMCSMSLSAAESVQDLTGEARERYIMESLSIETEEHITVSGGAHDFGLPGGYISTYASGESITEWIPYQGAREISRPEFLEIAGFPELAAEERDFEQRLSTHNAAMWGCLGAGLAGILGGMLLALIPHTEGAAIAGIALSAAGAASTIASFVLYFTPPESDISISFAVNVADLYNEELLSSL